MTASVMLIRQGSGQVDGDQRWYGWLSARGMREDLEAWRSTGLADAMSPDVIIDVDPDSGRWRPITGTDAECRALRAAVRGMS